MIMFESYVIIIIYKYLNTEQNELLFYCKVFLFKETHLPFNKSFSWDFKNYYQTEVACNIFAIFQPPINL